MNTYPSYKDSGVEWIGEIPSEWNIKPMYTQYRQNRIRNDNSTDTVLSLSYGNLVKRDIKKNQGLLPDNFDSYQLLDVGYIILRMTDLQNDHKSLRVGICEFPGIITSAYIGLSPFKSVHSRYFFYYLYMCDLKKVFYGLGGGLRQSVSYNDFKRFSLIVPPLQEQQQISDYLDYKTSKIDILIEKTQQKIELLKEQRTSLINTTVTKGLDPNVEMKDSGVEWIGDIPNGWDIKRLDHFFTQRKDKVDDVSYPPLSVTMNGILDQLDDVAKSDDSSNRKLVLKNDFVINSRSDRKGSSGISFRDGSVSLINTVLEPKNINPNYVEYLLKSYYFIEEYFRFGKGIHFDLWSTNYSLMKNIKIPVLSIEEQQQISDYLDYKTSKIDKLVNIESKRIDLLKEYRQSLISEVVTGKVDVRDEVLV